ncbi:MAG TPA: hypothetical protein VLF20_04440 [Patescibacteria group bacterium]|nr:hypothetical protein [Patescibacteria group bacterium]
MKDIQRGPYIHYRQRDISVGQVTAKNILGLREPVRRIVKRLRNEIERASHDNPESKSVMMAKAASDLRVYAKEDFESHVLMDGVWVVPSSFTNVAYRAYELFVNFQTPPMQLIETWVFLAAARVGHSANRRRRLNREANKLIQEARVADN